MESGGHRRLALVVGVSDYKSPKVQDLQGPRRDARAIYDVLTAPRGLAFPEQNVCLLTDQEATTSGFKTAFDRLVDRAHSDDIAVIYFAGHGSQLPDENGDEPDEWDETLLFHDSRTQGVPDFVDDELNTMLARLYAKTKKLTLILDSCNSGSAQRGEGVNRVVRYQPPVTKERGGTGSSSRGEGDESSGWKPSRMPEAVFISAAADGTSAIEEDGAGVFTSALISALATSGPTGVTYAKLSRAVSRLVAARSTQVPVFQGQLDRYAFGTKVQDRPLGWEITRVDSSYQLQGIMLPGFSKGAVLRVFDGGLEADDFRDPAKAKGLLQLTSSSGTSAEATRMEEEDDAQPFKEGDIGVLLRPGEDITVLRVRIARTDGAVKQRLAKEIERKSQSTNQRRAAISFVTEPDAWELSQTADGKLELRDTSGRLRNILDSRGGDLATQAADTLWNHALQKAFFYIKGDVGDDFVNDETLKVQLIPEKNQTQCTKRDAWTQAPANSEQVVPLCHKVKLSVSLSAASPYPLLVGGVLLSSDGAIIGLPLDGRLERLEPGGAPMTFAAEITGVPPLSIREHAIIVGTRETEPMYWNRLNNAGAGTRSASPGGGGNILSVIMQSPGTRGIRVKAPSSHPTWTTTHFTWRVEANEGFAQSSGGSMKKREYTIPNFDIRPYLPENKKASLYKVLQKADWLAKFSNTDGVGYHQHAWREKNDEANLKLGLDCSRAIWFAFTRAGLKYNKKNEYVWTGKMVGKDSPMSEEFKDCSKEAELHIGDILVYRDEKRGDGHTVMVIDPEKRIAWGSHGWDGNVKEDKSRDTGVEYQLIKYKKDWQRWDRSTMERKACWRYRGFGDAAIELDDLEGRDLTLACNTRANCGRGKGR